MAERPTAGRNALASSWDGVDIQCSALVKDCLAAILNAEPLAACAEDICARAHCSQAQGHAHNSGWPLHESRCGAADPPEQHATNDIHRDRRLAPGYRQWPAPPEGLLPLRRQPRDSARQWARAPDVPAHRKTGRFAASWYLRRAMPCSARLRLPLEERMDRDGR